MTFASCSYGVSEEDSFIPPRSNNDNEQVAKVIIWSTYIFASKGSKYKQPKQTYSKRIW